MPIFYFNLDVAIKYILQNTNTHFFLMDSNVYFFYLFSGLSKIYTFLTVIGVGRDR